MKFVHTADIHLDSPMRGLERYEGAPIDEMRGATRRALGNLVDLCLEEQVELLVVAGDLYDGQWPDYNTGLFFIQQISRLTRSGIRVIWIRGNHDAESRITRRLELPEGAFELSARRPETRVFESLGVAVHGQSYAQRDTRSDLSAAYPAPHAGLFNLGVLHTALEGRPGHDAYAPCRVEQLAAHGYDYWALGHVHRRELVHEDPWIVFPGNLQGRHAREPGPKGATLVTVEGGRVSAVEARELDVVRWVDCEVPAGDARSLLDVLDRARPALERVVEGVGERTAAVRVRVTGASDADPELRLAAERFRNEVRGLALALGAPAWVEKVVLETSPRGAAEDLSSPDSPLAGLLAALRARGPSGGAETEAELAEVVRETLAPLLTKLPRAYGGLPEALDPSDPASLATLYREIEEEILARVLVRGEPA